jgi:hypothetical protein
MGGAIAHGLATKFGLISVCYNPLGLGAGAQAWVGTEALLEADSTKRKYHVSIITHGDWVAGKDQLALLGNTKTPGQRVLIPNYIDGAGRKGKFTYWQRRRIHNEYYNAAQMALKNKKPSGEFLAAIAPPQNTADPTASM